MLQQSEMEDFLIVMVILISFQNNRCHNGRQYTFGGISRFFCVLMSGHRFIGKLSHNDPYLLPALADLLCTIEPRFSDFICFTDNIISDFDAVIATGSNNTSRYFDFYFSKYPNIIRKTETL